MRQSGATRRAEEACGSTAHGRARCSWAAVRAVCGCVGAARKLSGSVGIAVMSCSGTGTRGCMTKSAARDEGRGPRGSCSSALRVLPFKMAAISLFEMKARLNTFPFGHCS